MSDDRGSNDSDDAAADSDDAAAPSAAADWSANGKHADEVNPALEAAQVEAAQVEAAQVEAADAADAGAESATAVADAATTPGDDGSTFLSALVEAMQTTATAERARVVDDTDHRLEAHLARVQARREAEATTMRELADADLKSIDSWAEDERRRIQEERQRRATARQTLLETTLAEHGATIDREIEAVEAAIGTYRADTDAFFATLGHETDPVEIARHASRRPVFPALETIGDPTAETTDEGAPVTGVMARPAAADLGTNWARWNSSIAAAESPATEWATTEPAATEPVATEPVATEPTATEWAATESTATEPATTEPTEAAATKPAEATAATPTPLTASAVVSGQGRVLQTTPVSRPMSWLRRDRDTGEPPSGDR